jgi:mannose-6-phosphate isomerase
MTMQPNHPIERRLAERWRAWAVREALPFWRDRGAHVTRPLFFERLRLDGRGDAAAPLRVRTQARQIDTFARAAVLGLDPEGATLARTALVELRARAWRTGPPAGWVHVLTPDGEVADDRLDLYDQAFVLLMLAHVWRATGEPFVRRWIDETLTALERTFAAPSGGFAETDTGGLPRRQNPHMHLFEAMQALFEATGDPRFLARAGALYGLFRTRFFDETHAVVREFFTADWSPAPAGGERVEAGHLAEWVWLLRRYEALGGTPVDDLCARLLASARRFGVTAASAPFLVDEATLEAGPCAFTRRLWPQTEYLKALVVEARRASAPTALWEEAERLSTALFESYLAEIPSGAWRDRFTDDGRADVDTIPASTFYHLFGVVAELVR